jgi:hypothetical protein
MIFAISVLDQRLAFTAPARHNALRHPAIEVPEIYVFQR